VSIHFGTSTEVSKRHFGPKYGIVHPQLATPSADYAWNPLAVVMEWLATAFFLSCWFANRHTKHVQLKDKMSSIINQ